MTITININNLTLCHKGSDGISHNTLPDVCKTPDKGIPKPYENEAYSKDLVKGTTTCFADGGNMIANLGSEFAVSVFDEPGTMGGVVSGTNMAEADWISHSFDVFFEGKPACRLTDKMFHNHRNTVNQSGEIQPDLPPDNLSEKCKKIWNAINTKLYRVRPPTPKGGRPQGMQGLATRWREYAENPRNRGGKFATNHLNEYEKQQEKLQEDLDRWKKNNCDDDDLPPNARQYAKQVPELGPGKPTAPDPDGQSWASSAAKAGGLVVTIIVISRIIRMIPPLWPTQASPI
jgi:hypothetical protein